ncbi:MAG: MaoC family dehydratase [Chloroflexi bacterium]|nr:MAG: MaoC family dehydratase [Chloroflexota bacterium]TMD56732.1 MAG: MaoC family dehydratase [Chloroflexota bacterium]
MSEPLRVGDQVRWSRTFTVEDVERFGQVSGDHGIHHVEPDAQGRLMVQGLLTATLPTKLGGDLNYLAREMLFEFLRPVFSGDTIDCVVTVSRVEKQPGRTYLEFEIVCTNQAGKVVLRASTKGVVLDPGPAQ